MDTATKDENVEKLPKKNKFFNFFFCYLMPYNASAILVIFTFGFIKIKILLVTQKVTTIVIM